MAAATPFNIMIGSAPSTNGHFIPAVPVPGGTDMWVSTGPDSRVNTHDLQQRLAISANVVISTGSGNITLVDRLIVNSDSRLSFGANNIVLGAAIMGPHLNLTLRTPGTVMSDMGATLTLGGLTMDVGEGCQIGLPNSGNPASMVNGIIDGSNIVFENTKVEQGTHFFNGMDLSDVLAQKVANTAASGTKATAASTASTASTATTVKTPTPTPAPPSMTAAFDNAAAQSQGKTDADQDQSKTPKAKK